MAILFDWDGTLLDSYAAGFGASMAVFRHFEIPVDRERFLTLIAKSSKHENAKQPHWAQARSSCWGTRSPPL